MAEQTTPLAPTNNPQTTGGTTVVAPADSATPGTTTGTTTPGATTTPAANPYPTAEQIHQVCPDADINAIRENAPYILKAMCAAGLVSKNQLIGMIATIYTEVRSFKPIPEEGQGGGKHGNYYGRGYIQITHLGNYEAAEKELNIPGLVANPDLALDPETAARITTWYWKGSHLGNVAPYAEQGDWDNVRSCVNAGHPGSYQYCWGQETFEPAIQRGIQTFTQDLDPAAIGAMPLDGTYGIGDVDPGSGGTRTLTHLNPQNQAAALAHAMGITARAMSRALEFRADLDPAVDDKVLDLDAQKTFEVKGIGEGLDGTYTTEDVLFIFNGKLEVELTGYQPDPNAPKPTAFGNSAPTATTATGPPPAPGEINARILQAAQAARGASSANGPGGGNVACAWCMNTLVFPAAGIKPIGDNPNYVPSVEAALQGGRGQKLDRGSAGPGDIAIMAGQAHIGVCMDQGCNTILSNSSSGASFSWEGSWEDYEGYYGAGMSLYRVTS